MSRIVLDAATIAKLTAELRPVEICDEQGNVVGFFRPKPDPAKYGPLEPQISEEEMRRRETSTEPRFTTAEILEQLKKLENG